MDNYNELHSQVLSLVDGLKSTFNLVHKDKDEWLLQYNRLHEKYNAELLAHRACQERLDALTKDAEKMKAHIAVLEEHGSSSANADTCCH